MKLLTATVVAAMLCTTVAFAEQAPTSAGADVRVRYVTYNALDVVKIDTRLKINTAIELARGEQITSVLLGDSESFEVDVLSSGHVISVKPVIKGAQTNMTVYTNRNVYSFVLTEGRSQNSVYRVAFRYPETNLFGKAAPTPDIEATRHTNYQWSGTPELKPMRIWANGAFTYFQFTDGSRPSIFAVEANGNERTINSTTRNGIVRVRGADENYTIRLGDRYVCIRKINDDRTITMSEQTAMATLELEGWGQ